MASALASKTSTAGAAPDQCRPGPSRPAVPVRTAAAAMRWSRSPMPRNTCPTSNSATSPWPRAALRPAAATRPGSRLGRMSDRSAAIGLASGSAGRPSPNSSASLRETKDQVTASTRPEAASARLAWRVRRCSGVRMACATPSPSGGSGLGSTRSTPAMRTTSSTRSAVPATSGRNEGTRTNSVVASPASRASSKPSASRILAISAGSSVRPVRRATSLSGKAMRTSGSGTAPASVTAEAVPPQWASTIAVARSRPGRVPAGSMPRSKR